MEPPGLFPHCAYPKPRWRWCQTKLGACFITGSLFWGYPKSGFAAHLQVIRTALLAMSLNGDQVPAQTPDWKTSGRVLALHCHSRDLSLSRQPLCSVCTIKCHVLALLPAALQPPHPPNRMAVFILLMGKALHPVLTIELFPGTMQGSSAWSETALRQGLF